MNQSDRQGGHRSGRTGFNRPAPARRRVTTGEDYEAPDAEDRADVEDAVRERRDNDGPAVYSQAARVVPEAERLSVSVLDQTVKNYLHNLGHKPTGIIAESGTSIGESAGIAGATKGKKIYLFRDGISGIDEAVRTLWHELLHYGLRRFMTKRQYISEMNRLYKQDKFLKQRAKS